MIDYHFTPRQTLLEFDLGNAYTFESFLLNKPSDLIETLKDLMRNIGRPGARSAHIWGEHGTGKTHLLYACGNFCAANKIPHSYFSLTEAKHTESLGNIEPQSALVLLIDDIGNVTQKQPYSGLLRLYDETIAASGVVISCSAVSPYELKGVIPDLPSRLNSKCVYHLELLDDGIVYSALMHRAEVLGFTLPGEVIDYLFRYYSRDISLLCRCIDQLVLHAFEEKRRITIPLLQKSGLLE